MIMRRMSLTVAALSVMAMFASNAKADYEFLRPFTPGVVRAGLQYGGPRQDFVATNLTIVDYNNYSSPLRLSFGLKFSSYEPLRKRYVYVGNNAKYQMYITTPNGAVLVGAVFKNMATAKLDDMGNGRFLFVSNVGFVQTIPNTQNNFEVSFVINTNKPEGFQIEFGYVHINVFIPPALQSFTEDMKEHALNEEEEDDF